MGNSPLKSAAVDRPMPVKRPLELADDNSPIEVKKPKISEEHTLELTDINDHCLWHTFEFLDADDLVNIAEAHARFVPVATSIFRRLYRKTKQLVVDFGLLPSHQNHHPTSLCPADENIEPLFRHFGHLITDVLVNFLGGKHVEIETLLQEHSADSLLKLDLAFCGSDDFASINKPFPKLEKLQVIESTLNQNVSQLNIWFPNIQHLELVYVTLSQPDLLEVNLPQLKHLEIYNYDVELPIETIREMLRKNPQLTSLKLLSEYGVSFIESLSQNLPALEVLELWAPADRFSSFNDAKFHFASVKKFTLNACSSRGDFLVNVPFTFDALEELVFDGFNQFKGQILDFVMQCKMVKNLKLVPYVDDWDDLMLDDLRKIFDALPQLTALEFCADTFPVNDLMQLLGANEQLDDVILVLMEMIWCEHFHREIAKQWHLTKQIVEKYKSGEDFVHSFVQFQLKRKNLKQ